MTQSFDIRFARSAGLAGLFEAPSNSFRWSGSGRLSIDAQGISIAGSRGLLSLLARSRARHIPTANLKEVFREGDSLRVEFATDETPRVSLRFWAHDRETAARIVQLLPPSRSIELEDAAVPGKFQFNRSVLALSGVTTAVLAGVAIWLVLPAESPSGKSPAFTGVAAAATPVASTPSGEMPTPARVESTTAEEPEASAIQTKPQPSVAALPIRPLSPAPPIAAFPAKNEPLVPPASQDPPAEDLIPDQLPEIELAPVTAPVSVPSRRSAGDAEVIALQKGTPAWSEALHQLAIFGSESDDLLADYDTDYKMFIAGQMSRVDLATKLSSYERRWWDVTNRILEAEAFADPALVDLRATLLACVRHRRSFLTQYADGLRRNDSQLIKRALSEQERADELNARARRFIG